MEVQVIEDVTNIFSKVLSCGLNGINAYPVEIEINISGGLPNFILVGLPDIAVNESRERVRAAIKASGYGFPSKKIVVNLAPADTKKAGPTYDLPIAIGILAALNHLKKENLERFIIAGELGLFGKLRPVNGTLSFVMLAKKINAKGIIIPNENIKEGSLISGIDVFPASSLSEVIHIINNYPNIKSFDKSLLKTKNTLKSKNTIDLSEVKGQLLAKRALEISACGKHHLLMIGPPGAGKSMLAERFPTILPTLTENEKIEITQIYSACGKLKNKDSLITEPPFRTPHHSISTAGLIGGGTLPMPGEISLAHKGVLFLDELTEFQKHVLNSLRQAIETKEVTIARSRKSLSFPCDFTLIAACNPCPCGYFGDETKKCICNLQAIKKYTSKISGPLLDRIDLQVEVKRLKDIELVNPKLNETSDAVRKRVEKAREIQRKRYKDLRIDSNSKLSSKLINEFCKLNTEGEKILKEAIKSFSLTGRSYDRVLKVSRTIADLSSSEIITEKHILEALQFRLNRDFV